MDIDKANQHFKDMKEKVIGPILRILNEIESVQPESFQFPSWKEGSNSIFGKNLQSEIFHSLPEKVLFYDFLNNHYPEVKKTWDKAENELNSRDINYRQLRDLISRLLEKELREQSLYSSYVKELRPRTEKRELYPDERPDCIYGKYFKVENFIKESTNFNFQIYSEQYIYLNFYVSGLGELIYKTQKNDAFSIRDKLVRTYNSLKTDWGARLDQIERDRWSREVFDSQIKQILEHNSIKYDSSPDYECLDFLLFRASLKELMKSSIDPNSVFDIYQFQYLYLCDKMIYKTQKNDAQDVQQKLERIVDVIMSDEEIKCLRSEYERSEEAYANRVEFNKLKTNLEIILHKTGLSRAHCEFVSS